LLKLQNEIKNNSLTSDNPKIVSKTQHIIEIQKLAACSKYFFKITGINLMVMKKNSSPNGVFSNCLKWMLLY